MDTSIEITLKPNNVERPPLVRVSIGDQQFVDKLGINTTYRFNLIPEKGSQITVTVEHYGKTEKEYADSIDTAVLIDKIKINGISDPKFVWAGKFYPEYPSWEEDRGPIDTHYLGFNGVWKLVIDIPTFTWIHKIQGLGWIYD
jgi:hypothetical protein